MTMDPIIHAVTMTDQKKAFLILQADVDFVEFF